MIVFRRRPSGPAGFATAILLVAGTFGSALAGCGSSEQDAGSGEAGPVSTPVPPDGGAEERARADRAGVPDAGAPDARRTAEDRARSRSAGKRAAQDGPGPAGGRRGAGTKKKGTKKQARTTKAACPPAFSRAECEARIEAEPDRSRAYPVAEPQDCTKVMSKAQCEEILVAQKTAEENAGPAIDPETCLEEHSREYCVAQLGSRYEQQQAASQGAGQ